MSSSSVGGLFSGLNPLSGRVVTRDGFPIAPGAYPVVGHALAIARDELGLVRSLQERLGPFFFLKVGDESQLYCTLRESFDLFRSRTADSSYMREGATGDLFGSAVITQDGAEHRRMRGAIDGPFQPKGLSEIGVGQLVGGIVERRVRSLVGKRDVALLAETRSLALEVLFRLVGIEDENLDEWRVNYERLGLLMLPFALDMPGTPRRMGKQARAWIDARLNVILDAHEKEKEPRGLVGALARGRDTEGKSLSRQEMLDNLRLLLLAGHETSASVMAWCVSYLATQPDVWQRLCDEAKSALDLPRAPRDLRAFPYAESIFRETLRLMPPVSRDARRTTAPMEIAGRSIPVGTMVAIPIAYLSRDPEAYPEPDAFQPERWLGKLEQISPLERMQFGGGAHFCLGYHMAWMEIVQFLVALAREMPAAPQLAGAFPAVRWMPLVHPAASARAHFG